MSTENTTKIPLDIKEGLATALAEKIAALNNKKHVRTDNNNDGSHSGSTGLTQTGTSNSPTNISSSRAVSNISRASKSSTGSSGQSDRGINIVSNTSETNGHSNRTEQSNTVSPITSSKSQFSMRGAIDPTDRQGSTGGNDRGTNGGQDRGDSGEGTAQSAPVVVNIPGSEPTGLRRGRKPKSATSEEVSLDVITYAIETGFAITGSIRGPHWVRSTEQCQAVSIPLKKCLDRLPSKVADKVNNWIDPAAAAISLYLLVIPGLAYEQAVRNGTLPQIIDKETQVPINEPSNTIQEKSGFSRQSNPTTNRTDRSNFGNRFRSPIVDNQTETN